MKFLFGTKSLPSGGGFYQYVSTAAIAFMTICSGMHFGWSSPSLEKFQEEDSPIKITNSEGSWLVVMSMIGVILGSSITSVTVDTLGRKRAIILSGPLYFISWILIANAKSVEILYLARFIAGFTDSLLWTGCTMYTAEISAPTIRGFLASCSPVTWILGMLLINIVGSYFSVSTTAWFSSILPVVSVFIFCWMPESPYGLLMKGDYKGAERSLQHFRGVKNVESELNRISEGIQVLSSNTGKFTDLITVKGNRRGILIMLLLRSVQLFSGAASIVFYTQTIFKEAGGSISPAIASTIYVTMQLIMCMLSSSIVDIAGRRPLLLISVGLSAVTLSIEGTYFLLKAYTNIEIDNYSYVALIALLGYVVVFSLGMQLIPLLILGEIFPANIKAFAICASDIYYALAAIAASKFFQIMKDNYGMHVPFYAFASVCAVGLILMYFVVPETKGKTLEEIQSHLKGEIVHQHDEEMETKHVHI